MTADLRRAILAALPGTMPELAERCGVSRTPAFRQEVVAMKWDGLLRRLPGGVYEAGAIPGRPAHEFALPCPPGGKGKKFGVVLVAAPGWPRQDPGRVMAYMKVDTSREAVELAQQMRQLYPRLKWTAARMRGSDLIALTGAIKQKPHPARADGPPVDAIPEWINDL